MHVRFSTQTVIHTFTDLFAQKFMLFHTYTHIYIYTHTYTHLQIHTHTHIHTYIHTINKKLMMTGF
jgi:hypothetical protein